MLIRLFLDPTVVNDPSLRGKEVYRHRPSAFFSICRTIDLDQGFPIGMAQFFKIHQQPCGKATDALMNPVKPNRFEMSQTNHHCRYVQVIKRAILECSRGISKVVLFSLYRCHRNCATGKPGAL